jgi:hypothetical protein
MFSMYLFLLSYKIIGTAICAFLSFRIANLRMTPTLTYTLFAVGFSIRLILYVIGIFYTSSIYGFLGSFPEWLVILTQFLESLMVTAFVIGFAKKYGYLTRRLPKRKQ